MALLLQHQPNHHQHCRQLASLLARVAAQGLHGWGCAIAGPHPQSPAEQQHASRSGAGAAPSSSAAAHAAAGPSCSTPLGFRGRRAWHAAAPSAHLLLGSGTAAVAAQQQPLWRRSYHGTPPAHGPPDAMADPPAQPAQPPQQDHEQLPRGMRELLGVLSQPLPLGSARNFALNDAVVKMGDDVLFLDPQRMLESTMRALYVVKQVLRLNGHVCVFNSNPAFAPLMRHAARHSTNCNMWWVTEPYAPGTLLRQPASVMSAAAQPARARLQAKRLAMVNVHCPAPDALDKPAPRLDTVDKWRLWSTPARGASGVRGRQVLRRAVADEVQSARLLLPGAGNQQFAPTLILVLDLSHDGQVVHDAHEAGILTSSVVNAHSELDRITYPILAAEAHPAYTHFLLDWLLKVTNLPTPPLPAPGGPAAQQPQDA